MRSALRILGYNKGIDKKTLATTFLDTMYEDLKAKRSQSDHKILWPVSNLRGSDSWKYRIANNGKNLVGVTLNMPNEWPISMQLRDIFVTPY
jgi:hypothetical protein